MILQDRYFRIYFINKDTESEKDNLLKVIQLISGRFKFESKYYSKVCSFVLYSATSSSVLLFILRSININANLIPSVAKHMYKFIEKAWGQIQVWVNVLPFATWLFQVNWF